MTSSNGGAMRITIVATALLALLAVPLAVAAQKPVSAAETVSATFTIKAIDKTSRIVTLEDKTGHSTDVYCGPEVQRFDSLKVGDTVTFRYHESMVTAISHAGDK